jgi:hypothetical protein
MAARPPHAATVARAGATNEGPTIIQERLYDAKFGQGELHAARKYCLALPNGPANYEATLQPASVQIPGGTVGPVHGHPLGGLYHTDWGAADPNGGVARVSIDLQDTDPVNKTFTQQRHSMILSFVNAPAGFDAHFLPWDGRGGVVYMTLGGGGPAVFFTAALSGCTVAVKGAAAAPTVYHCGVDDWNNSGYVAAGNVAPAGNVTPQLWEDLLNWLPGGAPAGIVDKTDYVNDYTVGAPMTTARSRQIEPRLRRTKGDGHASAIPWGAVFGVRTGGNWSFYLQQNVTMSWTHTKFFSRAQIAKSKSRPLNVRCFFPAGVDHAKLWRSL